MRSRISCGRTFAASAELCPRLLVWLNVNSMLEIVQSLEELEDDELETAAKSGRNEKKKQKKTINFFFITKYTFTQMNTNL